jgi:NAD(P)H-dependent FMN reductase
MSRLLVDMLDGIELAEMCELVDEWLAADPAARASYARHVGTPDAAEDLRTALQHFAALLTVAPVTEADR